jgi:uncharacterized protein
MSATPSTQVTRLREKQESSRDRLDELLDSTPLATIALVRDGHPVVFPTGFARLGDEVVIHGSTGSPWLRALASGEPAAVSVTTLDGVVVARSSFESSFRYRSAVIFGAFETVPAGDKVRYLDALVESLTVSYGPPLAAPDVLVGTPTPASVCALSGNTPPPPR